MRSNNSKTGPVVGVILALALSACAPALPPQETAARIHAANVYCNDAHTRTDGDGVPVDKRDWCLDRFAAGQCLTDNECNAFFGRPF